MPKYNNAKNCITDLAITSQKRKTTTQVKVQTMKKSADKTSAHAQSYNLRAKVHQYQITNLTKCDHQQKRAENSKIF